MNSRRLWNLHQRYKFLRPRHLGAFWNLESRKRHFQGFSRGIFSTVDAMLLRQNTRETRNYAPEMSYVCYDMEQFERFTDIYIQCHSSSLFDFGTYFLLAVTVDGNGSRRLKEWLTSRQFCRLPTLIDSPDKALYVMMKISATFTVLLGVLDLFVRTPLPSIQLTETETKTQESMLRVYVLSLSQLPNEVDFC